MAEEEYKNEQLLKIYRQILCGVVKEDSIYVIDEAWGRVWDKLAGEIAEIRERNPKATFDLLSDG